MTVPAWASKKQQGEPALWSSKKDLGTGPESSSFSSTPTEEEVKHPLHEMIAPSMEHIEAFLAVHVWWPSARLMRRTLKATGRVATQTPTNLAFVRSSLHSFASHVLREAALSLHMQKDARQSSLTNLHIFHADS